MRRGEWWWGRIPLRESGGKRRPMLIVSTDAFNQNQSYPKLLVVHITSVRRLGGPFAWEVPLPRGTAGLSRPSVVKCSEIYTMHKELLDRAGGVLPASAMTMVDRALAVSLSLR